MKKQLIYFTMILSLMNLSACTSTKALSLSGTVEATQIDINAEANGKITEVLKDEGDEIHTDDVIALIDSAAAKIQVENAKAQLAFSKAKLAELKAGTRYEQIQQAEAAVKNAKARLDELKNGSRKEQIEQNEALYKQTQDGVAAAQTNYNYRLNNLNRLKDIYNTGGISKQQLDDAQNAFDTANQQLLNAKEQMNAASAQLELIKNGATAESITAAEGNYEQAEAQLQQLKNGATAESIQAAAATVDQMQANLDSANLQLEKCTIKSPIDGILLTKSIDVGQVVSVGTSIASIQQNKDYRIKVYLPQEHNAKLNLNQNVRINISSLPGQNISGTVIYKSPKAEFTPKNIQTTKSKERDTVIEVKVRIDGNTDEISAGMVATVYVD